MMNYKNIIFDIGNILIDYNLDVKLTDFYERDEQGNILMENGSPVTTYRITKRGAKGVSTLKESGKIGKIVAVKSVFCDEDIMAITNAGIIIRTHLNEFRITGRNTQGVRLINLEDKQKVSSITIVPFEEDAPEVEQIVEETETKVEE